MLGQDRLGHVGILERLGFAPVVDLPHPIGVATAAHEVRVRIFAEHRIDLLQSVAHIAVNRHVSELVLVNLGGVDVDVDDLAVLGELGELAGDAVVEADAEGEEEVGIVDGVVGVHGAVHAHHVEAEVVVRGEVADAVEREADGDTGEFGELLQLCSGTRMRDAAARVDERPLARANGRDDRFQLRSPRLPRRPVARQVHRHVPVRHGRLQLQILGDVDDHRAGAARSRDVECFLHHASHIFDPLHEVVVLRDATANLDHRRLLERVGPDHGRVHLTGDGDDRRRIHLGIGETSHEVGRTGAAGRHADADLARGAGVAVGHEPAALLVPR